MKKQKKLTTGYIKIRARKGVRDGTILYALIDIRFSARSCPYCPDGDGFGQNSVCNDGYFGVNDGFY